MDPIITPTNSFCDASHLRPINLRFHLRSDVKHFRLVTPTQFDSALVCNVDNYSGFPLGCGHPRTFVNPGNVVNSDAPLNPIALTSFSKQTTRSSTHSTSRAYQPSAIGSKPMRRVYEVLLKSHDLHRLIQSRAHRPRSTHRHGSRAS